MSLDRLAMLAHESASSGGSTGLASPARLTVGLASSRGAKSKTDSHKGQEKATAGEGQYEKADTQSSAKKADDLIDSVSFTLNAFYVMKLVIPKMPPKPNGRACRFCSRKDDEWDPLQLRVFQRSRCPQR